MWQHVTNALLGIAVLIIAFLQLSGATLAWTLGILGAAIAIIGFWGAANTPETTVRHAN